MKITHARFIKPSSMLGIAPFLRSVVISSVLAAVALGIAEIAICLVVIQMGLLHILTPNVQADLFGELRTSVPVLILFWIATSGLSGLLGRLIIPYGHFARTARRNVLFLFAAGTGLLLALMLGSSIVRPAWPAVVANLAINAATLLSAFFIRRTVGFYLEGVDFRPSLNNLVSSLASSAMWSSTTLRCQLHQSARSA